MDKAKQSVFEKIYSQREWTSKESASGAGSELLATEHVRANLPSLVKRLGVKTLLDVGCGDFNWMKAIQLPCKYIGVDIVNTLIKEHERRYGGANREFRCLDLVEDPLPAADLIVCRLCFQHLPTREVLKAIGHFQESGAEWLLATSFWWPVNDDIPSGGFRYLNLCIEPFNFPPPIYGIHENPAPHCSVTLGLWRLKDCALSRNGRSETR